MTQEGSNRAINPWLMLAYKDLKHCATAKRPLAQFDAGGISYQLRHAGRSLWVVARWPSGVRVAYCLANSLGHETTLVDKRLGDDIQVRLKGKLGIIGVRVVPPTDRKPVLHWQTTLRPAEKLAVPFWPRDIVPLDDAQGQILSSQRGPQGNHLFATIHRPGEASLLYLHALGSMSEYFEQTQTSAKDRIGGVWPEIGYGLSPAPTDHPLTPEREYCIADAYAIGSPEAPEDDIATARLFLDLYAQAFVAMEKPPALYRNWPRRVAETLQDLTHSPKCGAEIDGHRYLRAYAGADDRPPESMVQLAVLVPLIEYGRNMGENFPLIRMLQRNLASFFDPQLSTMVRWLPSQNHLLKGQEEHMKPELMDSWYLWHTLGNLSRVACMGDAQARQLFLRSLKHGMQVARRFDYRWPVFYDMHTLDVIKAETKPGEGGEQDVGALYAHVMLQAHELTGEQEYLNEATRAARPLKGLGFKLAYQFNNVSFGAGAMYRLWKITGDEMFRGLSDVCWANLIGNLWLWDADYGHGKHYSTFMGLPPLTNAKYIALYEELEVLAAIHEYFRIAGDDVSVPLRVLLPEYCKYVVDRAWYHYPSELPVDLPAEKQQSGEILRYLSVPLEDIYDGWEKPGQVGQEVYGAAAPFIIATRHCHAVPGEKFRIHVSFPVKDLQVSARQNRATFRLVGDARCRSHVRVVADSPDPLPRLRLLLRSGDGWREHEGALADLGHMEWEVAGDAEIRVEWLHQRDRSHLNGHTREMTGKKINLPRKTRRRKTASR